MTRRGEAWGVRARDLLSATVRCDGPSELWDGVLYERLPSIPRRDFIEMAPDFAVEVRSPTDRWSATLAKCGMWCAHGVPVVWAIDPEQRLVVVFRGLAEPLEIGMDGAADASPVLPEFRLAVAELFEDLED